MSKLSPYFNVVRQNHQFRRIWLSQIISNFGDWFGVLAVFSLVLSYSESEFLLGMVIVIKFLSFAVTSPFAGYIADRFDRRKVMIACDFGRGAVVLSFLFVTDASMIWLVYVLTALQMAFAAVFEPAKQASIPNITSGDELVRANIVSNLSWSIIFTFGMGVGGLVTAWVGTDLVFIINGAGYIFSTWFLFKATIPHNRDASTLESLSNPIRGIMHGYTYLFANPHILRPALAKGTITFFLGAMVYLLILVSEELLMMGSIGLGLLYSSRGVGTAVGPVFVRRYFSDDRKWIMLMGMGMITAGLFYLMVGMMEVLWVMVVLVFFAHCGSGANWVMSTVLLQQRSPDSLRGRIFSSEWLLFTMTQALSVTGVSLIMEFGVLTLREAIMMYASGLIISGFIWLLLIVPKEARWNKYHEAQDWRREMRDHHLITPPTSGLNRDG